MMQTMWIRYTGAEPYMDNLYRTGEWQPGQSRKVLTYYGRRLLRHPDIFEMGSGSEGGGGSYDDSELRAKIQANTTALANKVDKVAGKGLSSADFTAAEKSKLAGLSAYNDAILKQRVQALETALGGNTVKTSVPPGAVFTDTIYDDTSLAGRVSALEAAGPGTGGGGSYDDTALKNRLTAAETALANKVDKESGKGLSTNDFSSAEKTKLAGLSNYNDSALAGRVSALEAKADADTKPELAAALTATQTVGGVASGTAFAAGTTLEAIVRAILAPAATPPGPQPTANLPIFATSTSVLQLDEIAIDNSLGEYIINLAAQTEQNPIYFDVPAAWNAEATAWNAMTNQWQRTNDWETSAVTHEIDGQTVAYTRWTDISEADAAATRARITWTV